MSAQATKTVVDRPRDALVQLGLDHAARQLGDVVSEALKGAPPEHLAADLEGRAPLPSGYRPSTGRARCPLMQLSG